MIVKNNYLAVEKAYIKDGYIIVENTKPIFGVKYKIIVLKDNKTVHYAIKQKATLPLQFGDGKYFINLFKNKSGNRYANIGSITINVKLDNPNAPYLHPNQYVDYTKKSPCVLKAQKICINCTTPEERYNVISKYVVGNIQYNFIKEILVAKKTGILPDIDECFKKKSGICQDIAAMTIAMLRSQGVPASLVIGTCDGKPHAWVKVYFENATKRFDPTAKIMKKNNVTNYKTQRWY